MFKIIIIGILTLLIIGYLNIIKRVKALEKVVKHYILK